MITNTFLQGILIGLAIAAPVGPIGFLCIQRTLMGGMFLGLATGLGTAAADALFGFVGVFGLRLMTSVIGAIELPLRLFGGAILIWLGYTTLKRKPERSAAVVRDAKSLFSAFATGFALTLANPASILLFAAVFAGLGVGAEARSHNDAVWLVAGVATGSAGWWLGLSGTVGLLRHRLPDRALRIVDIASGLALIGFALWSMIGVFGAY